MKETSEPRELITKGKILKISPSMLFNQTQKIFDIQIGRLVSLNEAIVSLGKLELEFERLIN